MTQFAQPLEARWQKAFAALITRLRHLEQITQVLDPGCFVVPYIATISASYVSGNPMVVMPAGNTVGPCQYLSSYTPTASATVLVVPAGQSYIVLGTLS